MLIRSSLMKSTKRLAVDVIDTSATHAANADAVADLIKMAALTAVFLATLKCRL